MVEEKSGVQAEAELPGEIAMVKYRKVQFVSSGPFDKPMFDVLSKNWWLYASSTTLEQISSVQTCLLKVTSETAKLVL